MFRRSGAASPRRVPAVGVEATRAPNRRRSRKMRKRRQRRVDRPSLDKKSDFHIVAADRNNTLAIHATPAECLGRARAANQKATELLGRQPPILRPRQRQVANEGNLQLRILLAQEVDASAQVGEFARDRGVLGLGSPPSI